MRLSGAIPHSCERSEPGSTRLLAPVLISAFLRCRGQIYGRVAGTPSSLSYIPSVEFSEFLQLTFPAADVAPAEKNEPERMRRFVGGRNVGERNERSECSEPRGGRRRPADVAAAVLLGVGPEANLYKARRRPEARRGHGKSITHFQYYFLLLISIDLRPSS